MAGLILVDGEEGAKTSMFPVAGQPLIELQARIAHGAGVGHIIVVVDSLPTALVACFDRLRAAGIQIDLARSAADAADRVHPDEELIVLDGGVIASREALARMIGAAPVIATLPDRADTERLERIDGARRWTGLAIVDGALLRSTAQVLGDWTLGPTLLRMALQAKVETSEFADVMRVTTAEEARSATRALTARPREAGPVAALITGPLVAVISPALFARHIPVGIIAALPLSLLLASVVAALAGLPLVGLGLVLVSGLPRLIADRLSQTSGRPVKLLAWAKVLLLPVFAVSALALAWQLYQGGGEWGGGALSLWLIVALALQPRVASRAPWLADAESSALIVLSASLAGQPLAGVAIALAHAVISQFMMVRRPA